MQAVVDGLITRYEQTGKGQPVVLLHGWGDTLASFHDLQAALAAKFKVVALDLPGFGQTQPPPKPWGLDDYAAFVGKFLTKLKLKPYCLIGHSNGGAVAIRGLARGKLRADKLVLLASAGIRGEHKGRTAAIKLITKTGKALSTPIPKSIRERLRHRVYTVVGSDMLVAEHLQDSFKLVVGDDVRTDCQKLSLPTLLLYGDKDNSTPLAYGKLLSDEIKGSVLDDIAPAGHFIHHDQPELVLSKIKEFL